MSGQSIRPHAGLVAVLVAWFIGMTAISVFVLADFPNTRAEAARAFVAGLGASDNTVVYATGDPSIGSELEAKAFDLFRGATGDDWESPAQVVGDLRKTGIPSVYACTMSLGDQRRFEIRLRLSGWGLRWHVSDVVSLREL